MTATKFIKEYCKDSKITENYFHRNFIALPCNCGDESCKGWATIQRDWWLIRSHLELYWKEPKKLEQ